MILFEKKFSSPVAWGVSAKDDIKGYVSISIHYTFPISVWFSVKVPNRTFNYNNPFTAIGKALESAAVGQAKYEALKELTRKKKLWQLL